MLERYIEDYRRIKEAHTEAILILRVGNCCEAFDDDAETLAKVCRLPIFTMPHPLRKGERITYTGFAQHNAEAYIMRALDAGQPVAIVEPVDPQQARTIQPDRIVSRSILTEDQP